MSVSVMTVLRTKPVGWKPVEFPLPRFRCECLMQLSNLRMMYDRHVATMEKPTSIDKLEAEGIGARPTLLSSYMPEVATICSVGRAET